MSNDLPPKRTPYVPRRDLSSLAGRLGAAWDLLAGRPFSPGLPVEPDPVTNGEIPRQFQFTVGQNTSRFPRGESVKGVMLTPFDSLRQLASAYDVASLCIATRVEQIQGLQWNIVPKDKRVIGDTKVMERIEALTRWWMYPDKVNDFPAWVGMLVYEILSIDAMTLYRRHTRSGHLYALEVVDGTTIKPIIDERGRTVGYQQVLWGETVSNYGRAYADAPDEQIFLTAQDLIYRPRYSRSFTPYGFPPTEWIILRINTALRKQTQDLAHFTDGNIPAMLAAPPDGMFDPGQLREFEELFNADLAGVDRARAKIKFMPFNANLQPLSPFNYSTEIDEWMMKVTCAAFGVTPSELGFTADINRATALAQESITYRRGIEGMAQWLKTMFDRVIHDDFGSPDLEWQWNFGKSDDRMVLAQLDQIYTGLGVLTPDEVRSMRFGHLLGSSPHAESMGIGGTEQNGLGIGKRPTGNWNTLVKSLPDEAPHSNTMVSPPTEPKLIAMRQALESDVALNPTFHFVEDMDMAGDAFPNDVIRSAIADAMRTILSDTLMQQQRRLTSSLTSAQHETNPISITVAINGALTGESERISADLQNVMLDAIIAGIRSALTQVDDQPEYGQLMAVAKLLADQEAHRVGMYLTEATRVALERNVTVQKSDSMPTFVGSAFPSGRKYLAAGMVNRAYHLGVQAVAKTVGRDTVWSTTDCPVCATPPDDADTLPSVNPACRCSVHLV